VLAQIFERWLPRLDVFDIHAHRLRHTFATEMLQRGAVLPDIQEAMGHSDIGTTRLYLRIDIERVRAAVGMLPIWD
jgi:site-specific recombinase XerD